MQIEKISKNISETQAIAQDLARQIIPGQVLALSGNLGAGKTVFVKALAQYFGVAENVTSPTFVLLKVYPTKHDKIKRIVHVDCYRLDNAEDLKDIGLDDYLQDDSNLVVIEWAEKIKQLPAGTIWVKIEYLEADQRKISIN